MSWLYLVLAGISELGWPLGFKMSAMAQAQNNAMHTVLWLGLALLSMVTSMAFLYLAQRHIHMGTAYIVWTGIGGMGTALVGIFFFQEPATLIRLLSLTAILAGLIGLSFAR
ncbi:MAG: multidrug efflux SMR transporter [Sutterella wadsworthensis]|nr:multidrug efflux SMR transporter [Sutterella wadsworthensis]